MYILNKVKLNKLGIPHYGKKLKDSIVRSDDATIVSCMYLLYVTL